VTRGLLGATLFLGLAAGAAAQVSQPAPRDTTPPDSAARRDSIAKDSAPHYLPVFAAAIAQGPVPRGARYTFTADSFAFTNAQTLSDLLGHIPGVYVARGGIYGATEAVLYGGRGAAGLEIYWDGVPYLPIGRDSVFLDPARISLAPLERVDVVVLPASLRVYLVTLRQSSTATTSEVGVATGDVATANYRGAFLRRWRSGLGLSLVADYNNNNGIAGSTSNPFRSVDLWLKAEYVPSERFGVSYQVLSSSWKRSAGLETDTWNSNRRDGILRVFAATRPDGLGLRAQATYATTSLTGDSAVSNRTASQGALELSDDWARAHLGVALRALDDLDRPWQVDGTGAWSPLPGLTLAGDARLARYSHDRNGRRAHLAAGLGLVAGFSLHGDLAWARDLQAPVDTVDRPQRTVDASGALRFERGRVMLEVGMATRDSFLPLGHPAGLRTIGGLGPTPRVRYATARGALELLPGLHLSGWYFNPLISGGNAFEPPYHARVSIAFYSKFWRVFRSGLFALRGEYALESWTRGAAGVDSTGQPLALGAGSFGEYNIELRIAGVTIFWVQHNASFFPGNYAPGFDYPRRFQFYGVRWWFTN
jgi:TonB-dependent receptor-like protein